MREWIFEAITGIEQFRFSDQLHVVAKILANEIFEVSRLVNSCMCQQDIQGERTLYLNILAGFGNLRITDFSVVVKLQVIDIIFKQ